MVMDGKALLNLPIERSSYALCCRSQIYDEVYPKTTKLNVGRNFLLTKSFQN